mgnify:FL=1
MSQFTPLLKLILLEIHNSCVAVYSYLLVIPKIYRLDLFQMLFCLVDRHLLIVYFNAYNYYRIFRELYIVCPVGILYSEGIASEFNEKNTSQSKIKRFDDSQ